MLLIQKELLSGKSIEELSEKHGLKTQVSSDGKLVVINYDKLFSDKRSPLIQQCRGLTLENGTWKVVARTFDRFFNYEEYPDLDKKFKWDNFVAEEKCDGSLMVLYFYNGEWRVNTRGSFAESEIQTGAGLSWKEGFFKALKNPEALSQLSEGYSYVFEFCSPYNKVVKQYKEETLFLLTIFHNASGSESSELKSDAVASSLGVNRPKRYNLQSLEDVLKFVSSHDIEATDEGCVLIDCRGMRLKIKNPRYVALHHLKDNNNLFLSNRLVPLILAGEASETLVYFPECAERLFSVVEKLEGAKGRLLCVWDCARGIEKQKDFAEYVNKHTQFSSILFQARKLNKNPKDIWHDSSELILRKLFKC